MIISPLIKQGIVFGYKVPENNPFNGLAPNVDPDFDPCRGYSYARKPTHKKRDYQKALLLAQESALPMEDQEYAKWKACHDLGFITAKDKFSKVITDHFTVEGKLKEGFYPSIVWNCEEVEQWVHKEASVKIWYDYLGPNIQDPNYEYRKILRLA